MKTKQLFISDRIPEFEAIKMFKSDDYTDNGKWQLIYMQKNGGFYNALMVQTDKGKYYDNLIDIQNLQGFIKVKEFTTCDTNRAMIEMKARNLCPKGFKFLYVDLKHYSHREDDKEYNTYLAMYELV